ncbi:MAG TPA: diaminopimelate decarboxylase [Pseudomonadales bacterium]
MIPFKRIDGRLYAEEVPVADIAAQVGTPVYVYSQRYLESRYRLLEQAMQPRGAEICYAVKANSNLSVLRAFAALGAGFDIVSGGELQRVVSAGGDPSRVIFSGVGKRVDEIDLALKLGIRCFNVESAPELARLSERARLHGRVAPVAIRVNPDIDAGTHPYISTGLATNKFGVPRAQARELYHRASRDPALAVCGIDCHIGSQIASPAPLLEALDSLLALVDELERDGIALHHIDLGGGLGVSYRLGLENLAGDAGTNGSGVDEGTEFDVAAYGRALNAALAGRHEQLILEPGRYLVANGGLLLTRVEYLKPADSPDGTDFAVLDAAMNDLIRPALYQAWHDVVPAGPTTSRAERRRWTLVGPVCESGDFLARDRDLALAPEDLLAVLSAGAYGMVQSSNYNTRGRPAEVMVQGDRFRVIRRRETVRDQLALELPDGQDALLGPADLAPTEPARVER